MISGAPNPPASHPPTWAVERARELDHEHRKRLRSTGPMLLSMRYLRAALGRMRRGTERVPGSAVARPHAGILSITFVGHASAMLTSDSGRILVDPVLEDRLYGLPRAKGAAIANSDLADVDLILITHAHRDHLSMKSLARLARSAQIVLPSGCEPLVRPLGFSDVVELEPGARFRRGSIEITAVPVLHSGKRGLASLRRRGASGYVVRAADVSAYVAGDTGYFSGFADVGQQFRPDVALLPIAGYEPAALRAEHLSPLDAVYAFEDLGARILIPTSYGSFPLGYERLDAPLEWLRQLAWERGLLPPRPPTAGLVGVGPGPDGRFVAVLDHGQTLHIRGRRA